MLVMNDHTDLKPVLDFLNGLRKNNNKAWFEVNRPAYESARGRFEEFIDRLIIGLGSVEDLGGITARDCVMRIYRDLRFSKDKSPYRLSMAASIGRGGKRSTRLTYYLHLEPPDASLLAGGLHAPDPARLTKFREAMDRNPKPFKDIVNNKAFGQIFGTVQGEKLKTAPKGFERDHPEIEWLRLKEVVALQHLTDAAVLSPDFGEHVMDAFAIMKPFLDYLNSVIG
jgi:uncharacterized protein (TIGR02453 family)